MSIQSEINRIISFRNDSFNAINEKGVTVSSGAIIDDLPGYIRQIVAASEIPYYNGEVAIPAYTVQIFLTNPVNGEYFYSCDINSASSSNDYSSTNKIKEITTASGSATVDISEYGFNIYLNGMSVAVPENGIICTGGVSYIGNDYSYGTWLFQVTDNGSVTLNNVNYND